MVESQDILAAIGSGLVFLAALISIWNKRKNKDKKGL